MWESTLWVALGSMIGGVSRFWIAEAFASWLNGPFPWGTIFINITGSFIIGFFSTLTGSEGRLLVPPTVRQFVMIGICGGYTTFSSFSLQSLNLAQEGVWGQAGLNVGLSVVLCLIAVWLGAVAASAINQLKGV